MIYVMGANRCNRIVLANIRLVLGVRGWTVTELARAMGCAQPTVSAMLAGVEYRATETMIGRAADALGVEMAVLRDPRLSSRVRRACRLGDMP